MDINKLTAKKILTVLFIILTTGFAACSGPGGDGTEDYRPYTEYGNGYHGEEPGGNINYPDGYIPPSVTINSPSSGLVVSPEQHSITVGGTLKKGDQDIKALLINGGDAKIASDNTFSVEIPLPADSKPFVAVEASAIDAKGYAGRDRIVVLRGASIASGEKASNAVGAVVGNPVLGLPARFDDVIKDLLNEAIGKKEFDMKNYITVEVTNPFKAVVQLKLTSIDVKRDYNVSINRLKATGPASEERAGLTADMSLAGIVIGADIKLISVDKYNLPANLADIKAVLELNSLAADMSMKMGVKTATGLGVDISKLNLKLKEVEADIPSTLILSILLNGIDVSESTYFMKLPVKGWLANVISNALNSVVNKKGLGLIVYVPQIKDFEVESILPAEGKNELLDSIKGIRNLKIDVELEKFTGTPDSIGFMAAMSGKSKSDKGTGVISLPPSKTLTDALNGLKDKDTALAISSDSINRMMAALNDSGFGLSLAIGELMPDLGLPGDMKADVMFGGPPFLDFRDGKIKLFVTNLKTGLYINSTQQLEVAIDLVSEVQTDISVVDGKPYMKLKLELNEFNIYYMADRLGIERAINLERAVKNLMPQIIELMQPWLDKNPLIVDDAVARDLIAQVNKDDDKLLASIADDLPIFKVGLYGLEADGGYLGIGINAE